MPRPFSFGRQLNLIVIMPFKFETANERWSEYKESAEHPLLKNPDWPREWAPGEGGWYGDSPYNKSPESQDASMKRKFMLQIQQKIETLSGAELQKLNNMLYKEFRR